MKFRILAIGICVCCCLLDTIGILVTLWFNDFVGKVAEANYTSHLEEISQDGRHLVISDFSHFRNIPVVVYTLPYIFSGVLPRMLNGFKCMTADQEVLDNLKVWNAALESLREEGKDDLSVIVDAFAPASWQLNIVNQTNIKLGKSIARRRIVCSDISFQDIKKATGLVNFGDGEWKKSYDAFQEFEDDYHSFHIMFLIQIGFMLVNIGANLTMVILVITNINFAMLYLPWFLLNAIEIAGNICVAVAFLIHPGKCQMTSLVCILRIAWLKWVWVDIVRKNMNIPRQTER